MRPSRPRNKAMRTTSGNTCSGGRSITDRGWGRLLHGRGRSAVDTLREAARGRGDSVRWHCSAFGGIPLAIPIRPRLAGHGDRRGQEIIMSPAVPHPRR